MTDQLEKIEEALEELFAGMEQIENLCAGFDIPSGDEWVEVTSSTLNVFWPYDEEDAEDFEEELRELLPHCNLVEVEEGVYAVYEIELLMAEDMADLVDWVLTEVLEVSEDYEIEAEVFEIEE
jgi:hypothetical protein